MKVTPQEFLSEENLGSAVFTQLAIEDYVERRDGGSVSRKHFYRNGELYQSVFGPYARKADLFINGVFWDGRAPAFFTKEEMQSPEFRIRTIADVTCDIAPAASVPSTLRASTIADPVFGYDPATGQETDAYSSGAIDVMSIDNLPSELPRDASKAFGQTLMEKILPEFTKSESGILRRATITADGKLGPHFAYLSEFAGIANKNKV